MRLSRAAVALGACGAFATSCFNGHPCREGVRDKERERGAEGRVHMLGLAIPSMSKLKAQSTHSNYSQCLVRVYPTKDTWKSRRLWDTFHEERAYFQHSSATRATWQLAPSPFLRSWSVRTCKGGVGGWGLLGWSQQTCKQSAEYQ